MPISTISQAGLDAPISLTSPTLTTPNIDSAQIATVSGTAPLYMCRAWVNFNGTGTVAIRASGNVSSITDNGTGDYTVNFTTAFPDANYATTATCSSGTDGFLVVASVNSRSGASTNPTTTAQRIFTRVSGANSDRDSEFVEVSVIR